MRELKDWERQHFINELSKTQKLLNENIDYFYTAISYFSITIANIVNWQTQLEDIVDRALILGETSMSNISKKLIKALEDIKEQKYCNNNNRNKLLETLAMSLSISSFDIAPFEQTSKIRNSFGHMRFHIVNDKNQIPILTIQSREEGNIDIEKFSARYIRYFNDAQDMLELIFRKFDIPSIYWKTSIKRNPIKI